MKIENMKPGMVVWTVLTDDPNGEPITQLIRGTITGVGSEHTFGFECSWQWAGGKVDWCWFPAAVVFETPTAAIEAYLADRASVLYADAALLLEDNVIIPNGWDNPDDWRGHHEYKRADE